MKRGRKILIGIVLVIVLLAAGAWGYVYHFTRHIVPESYAAWSSGEILVHYMRTHADQWPTSWENIGEATDSLLAERRNDVKWGIYVGCGLMTTNRDVVVSELKRWVKVEWSTQPAAHVSDSVRPRLVSRSNGRPFRMLWEDPSEMVYDYLVEKHRSPNPTSDGIRQPADGSQKRSM